MKKQSWGVFDKAMIYILRKVKKIVDNLYYKKYHQFNQETLVRTMFPWLVNIDSYSRLNSFLVSQDPLQVRQLVQAILSYYWAEVSSYHAKYDYNAVAQLKWLYEFANWLDLYSREIDSANS